mmetsp:Transcript_26026/g.61116  ORF Transcript_26026/g.61116 Transcript_26026/m.61116 type:complete len:246 (+) Transcript_26026:202-939(+)
MIRERMKSHACSGTGRDGNRNRSWFLSLSLSVREPLVGAAHVVDELGVPGLGRVGAGVFASDSGRAREHQRLVRARLREAADALEVVLVELERSLPSHHRKRERLGVRADLAGHGDLVFLSNIHHDVPRVLSSSLFVIFDDFLHLLFVDVCECRTAHAAGEKLAAAAAALSSESRRLNERGSGRGAVRAEFRKVIDADGGGGGGGGRRRRSDRNGRKGGARIRVATEECLSTTEEHQLVGVRPFR